MCHPLVWANSNGSGPYQLPSCILSKLYFWMGLHFKRFKFSVVCSKYAKAVSITSSINALLFYFYYSKLFCKCTLLPHTFLEKKKKTLSIHANLPITLEHSLCA
ncbi:hypothetical protein AAZX31_07G194100 [Glycine max]